MISVCIATYNGEKYIKQQLESILCQLNIDDEIIVSDDQSTDNTVNIIMNIGDTRIKVIEGPGKKSPTFNFENALRQAKGDYIFLADQDDVWKPNKVEICMRWLMEYDCVISDASMTNENLKVIEESYFKVHGTKYGRKFNTIIKNGYMGCCMAFTKQVLEDSLPFPKNIPLHDIWIGNVAAYWHNVRFIDDKLVLFRCHNDNNSFTAKNKSGFSPIKMLKFRLTIVKDIIIKQLKNNIAYNKINGKKSYSLD